MANSIYNSIQTTQMNGLGQIYSAMQSNNPMQIFHSLAQGNPQLQPIVQMLQNGNNPETIFRALARQRGIDPNQFINNLKRSIR